jgi:hypothetical protein
VSKALTSDGVRPLDGFGGRSDNLDGAHEDIRNHGDPQEQPEQRHQVEESEEPIVHEDDSRNQNVTVADFFRIIENHHLTS